MSVMSTPYYYTFPISTRNAKSSSTILTVPPTATDEDLPPTNPNPPGGRTL
jgi:hypothetical protein